MCNHPNPALHLTGYKQLRCFPPAGELELHGLPLSRKASGCWFGI